MSLLLGLLLLGQHVELPAQVRGSVGSFILVKPSKLDGKVVRYFTPDALSVFPNELLNDPTASVVVAARPGTYRIFAVTAKGDALSPVASTNVVIGDGLPDNPQPGPGPLPPGPKPPSPEDVKADPIFQALVGIVGGLGGEKAYLPKLAKAYEDASKVADCVDLGSFNEAAKNTVKASGLRQQDAGVVRDKLAEIIEKELGNDPSAQLAGGLGDKARNLFRRISKVLGALSNE